MPWTVTPQTIATQRRASRVQVGMLVLNTVIVPQVAAQAAGMHEEVDELYVLLAWNLLGEA